MASISLERKNIELKKYAHCKHFGPYNLLKQTGQKLNELMNKVLKSVSLIWNLRTLDKWWNKIRNWAHYVFEINFQPAGVPSRAMNKDRSPGAFKVQWRIRKDTGNARHSARFQFNPVYIFRNWSWTFHPINLTLSGIVFMQSFYYV